VALGTLVSAFWIHLGQQLDAQPTRVRLRQRGRAGRMLAVCELEFRLLFSPELPSGWRTWFTDC